MYEKVSEICSEVSQAQKTQNGLKIFRRPFPCLKANVVKGTITIGGDMLAILLKKIAKIGECFLVLTDQQLFSRH